MAKGGRLYELAFRIGGALNPSFVSSTTAAGKRLSALQRRNAALAKQQRLKQALGEVSGHLQTVGRVAAVTGAALGAMAVGAGVALFRLTSQTADLADAAIKQADNLGMSVESLQELYYAAQRYGASSEGMGKALQKLQVNIGKAMQGTGEAAKAFDRLGLSASALAGMSPDESLALISERLSTVNTDAERASLAFDIFGRSSVHMQKLLAAGPKELDRLRKAARATGNVLSERVARQAEVFQDRLLDLKMTMGGLKATIGAALIPVLTRLFEKMSGWFTKNRALVQRFADRLGALAERYLPMLVDAVERWIKQDMPRQLREAAEVGAMLWGWLSAIALATGWAVDKLGGLEPAIKKVAVAVGALYAVRLGAWLYEVAGAVWALGAAVAANPLVLLAGLLAIQVIGIILAVVWWDKLRDRFLALPTWAKVAGAALAWLTFPLWAVPALIVAIVKNLDKLGAAYDWVTDRAADAIGAIVRFADVIVPALLLGPLGLIAGLIYHYWDEITGAIRRLRDWMVEAGASLLRALAEGIRSATAEPVAAVAELVARISAALAPVNSAVRFVGMRVPGLSALYPDEPAPSAPSLGAAGKRLSGAMVAQQGGKNAGPSLSLDYRPQITLTGSEANRAGVAAAIKAGNDDLLERMQAALEQQRRLAYG